MSRSRARRLALGMLWTFVSGGAGAAIPASERTALIDLYNATNGPGWTTSTNWLGAPGTECSWAGVDCNGTSTNVNGLFLQVNNLSGSLPDSLGSLTQLEQLFLVGNHLSGPLPSGLGSTALRDLDVGGNALVGEIPLSLVNLPLDGDSGLNLRYNGLYATNAGLAGYLDSRQPGWETTQTVAPKDLAVVSVTNTTITLSWGLIAYTADPGAYLVMASTTPGGPYTLAGKTSDKGTFFFTVRDLSPGTTYRFVIETVTLSHSQNTNEIVSEPTPELSARTASPELPTATATVSGGGAVCAGGSAQISAALTGTPPWTVTWSDGVVQNVAASPATRTVTPAVTTTYTVTSVTTSAASGSGSGSAVVTVNPIPAAPLITAPVSLAPLQSGAASVESHTGSIYAWTVVNGTLTTPATGSSIGFVGGASGTVTLSVRETSAAGCVSAAGTRSVTIIDPCPPPGAAVLSSPSTTYTTGQAAFVTWSVASGLGTGGVYTLETSTDDFATLAGTLTTTGTSALLPTEQSGTDLRLSLRVRARKECGSASVSAVLTLSFRAAPASFLITREGPAWTAQAGDPPPSATVSYRNVGALPGRLSLSSTGNFFAVSPGLLDLAPGQEGSVTLTAIPAALRSAGSYRGLLVAVSGGDSLPTAVSLAVGRAVDARVTASASSVTFDAPAGQAPAPRQVTITVSSPDSEPVQVSQDLGPGGSWLVVTGLEQPILPGGSASLTLRVDRALRSFWEGPPPLRTVLRLTPVGGDPETDSAIVEVVDVETFTVTPGDDRGGAGSPAPQAAPPGGTSFLIPTVVKAVSGLTGQRFSTDAWLHNISGAPVPATLYFTPDGKDGLVDPAVRKASVTVPGGQTLRLPDLLGSVFRLEGTSGQVELRSQTPELLSLRTTVDSILADGNPATRFGTEMPTVAHGAGVGLGDGELAVPGIDDDDTNRANLILTETTGAAAFARVTLYGPDGAALGSREYGVPPYGKVQENRIVDRLVPGRALSGGWLGVTVISGKGRLVAVATVIDNRSGSFSAVLGRAIATAPSGRAPEATTGTYLIPSVARTVGLNNTLFKTRLDLVNQTASPVTLSMSYVYVDQDDGGALKEQTVPVTLPARGALPKAKAGDVLAGVFGVFNRSYGSILIRGDVSRVTGVAGVSSQVDPLDATKGFKTAQVNGVLLDAVEFLSAGAEERRVPNVEKSDYRRTNLILVEVKGQSCLVEVRARTAAGQSAGARTFGVAPFEYRQINQGELFGPDGLSLGEGPFQNLELSGRVVSGGCRVLGLATIIDNLSRNPEIFLLQPAAPPATGGSIGF